MSNALIPFDLLDELTDYFQQRADVKDGSDGPRPNREMLLQGRLESEVTQPEDGLLARVQQFESAIQRIAGHVGACCGGVDTGKEIDPYSGNPYGPGGHTAVEIMRKIDEKIQAVIEECADLADRKLDHYSGTECTYRGDVAEAIRELKKPLPQKDKS